MEWDSVVNINIILPSSAFFFVNVIVSFWSHFKPYKQKKGWRCLSSFEDLNHASQMTIIRLYHQNLMAFSLLLKIGYSVAFWVWESERRIIGLKSTFLQFLLKINIRNTISDHLTPHINHSFSALHYDIHSIYIYWLPIITIKLQIKRKWGERERGNEAAT